MAEFFGAIQRGLGEALNAIYQVIPSYGVAIILLTLAVRTVLIPLTLKQIRSMTAMQKMAPEQKKIQQKYKALQAKAKDRAEVMQLRQEMNREVMALYKTHGVNPAGGCLPLIAQAPAFIALYSVLRTSIVVVPLTATLMSGAAITPDLFAGQKLGSIICTPIQEPSPSGPNPDRITCSTTKGPMTFRVGKWVDAHTVQLAKATEVPNVPWITRCNPFRDSQGNIRFNCISALGTGHLPRDGELFSAVTRDRAVFLGMHLACTAPQAASKSRIRECTRKESDGGGGHSVPYYLLIALVIGSTYYQSKQMQRATAGSGATGAQMSQQQIMTRIMPVFFGFISLNFPAGLNVYFLVTNLWTIGQQSIVYRKKPEPAGAASDGGGRALGKVAKPVVSTDGGGDGDEVDKPAPKQPAARSSRSRKKRKRRR